MRELDFWEANRIPEDVVWEVCDTIFIGEHPRTPGARNVDSVGGLAIPVAEDAVRRHRAAFEGPADFRPRRPRGIINYDASASSQI